MFRNYKLKVICLILSLMLAAVASQARWKRKPTNSVTIRQSSNGLCDGHSTNEFVAHPEVCRSFYLCGEKGDAVLAFCPPTMLFNPEKKLCDAAENVSCNNMNDGTTSTNSPPSSSGNDFDNIVTDPATYCASLMPQQANDRIVYIGSSSSCSRYYICYYRQAIMQECSAELHWNSLTAKCDLPERAQCTLEQTIRPPSSNSNINSELIHCPTYGQHLYPYLKRCEFFIYCVKGHATLQQCPFYYYFDVLTKNCQWSRTAVCVRDLNYPQ